MVLIMVIGIGNDIIDVRRIVKTLGKSHGDTFKKRVFTDSEIAYCDKMANSGPHFAARWALKEAFYKALPEHLQPHSKWRSIELVREPLKKPYVSIVDDHLQQLFTDENLTLFHSISHEKEYCTALVIIEKSSK